MGCGRCQCHTQRVARNSFPLWRTAGKNDSCCDWDDSACGVCGKMMMPVSCCCCCLSWTGVARANPQSRVEALPRVTCPLPLRLPRTMGFAAAVAAAKTKKPDSCLRYWKTQPPPSPGYCWMRRKQMLQQHILLDDDKERTSTLLVGKVVKQPMKRVTRLGDCCCRCCCESTAHLQWSPTS